MISRRDRWVSPIPSPLEPLQFPDSPKGMEATFRPMLIGRITIDFNQRVISSLPKACALAPYIGQKDFNEASSDNSQPKSDIHFQLGDTTDLEERACKAYPHPAASSHANTNSVFARNYEERLL